MALGLTLAHSPGRRHRKRYVPEHFKIDDTSMLQQYIRDYGFGLLIVAGDRGIEAHHVPFLLGG